MASLLHQAALQPPHPTPNPYHSWTTHGSAAATSILSPPTSRRQRAASRRLHAAGDSASTDAPASSKEKTSRKEKQRQQQRLREREEQQQKMLKAAFAETAGEGNGKDGGGEDDDDELPQAVFDRILRRILFTVGVPMATGVALLSVYDALKRGRGVEVPQWVPLLTTLVAFGTSALGIAYGTLSASWDPEKEGSLLGIDEARTNWPELWKEEIEKEEKK